ncbi:unnamed protein product [Arctogadus glacialis]
MNINLLISVHVGFFCQMVCPEDFITPVSCCLKALARLHDAVAAQRRYAGVKLSVKLPESPCSGVHRALVSKLPAGDSISNIRRTGATLRALKAPSLVSLSGWFKACRGHRSQSFKDHGSFPCSRINEVPLLIYSKTVLLLHRLNSPSPLMLDIYLGPWVGG